MTMARHRKKALQMQHERDQALVRIEFLEKELKKATKADNKEERSSPSRDTL